ncbi:hypothetical protein VP01_1612g1 [Puccinia sorghi]|uniref:Uncharacterized protein n=1 Tax=Puccinia sorghi TaxID=27349 RepID=A0A0L6VH37_9BASI|nr:hypothetical protein VP01_1612g1 [Puccinia sorghi]
MISHPNNSPQSNHASEIISTQADTQRSKYNCLHHDIPSAIQFVCHPKPFLMLLPTNFPYELTMFSQSSSLDQTRSHILQPISESSTRFLNSTDQPHAAWDLMVMEQIFSDSRIYSKFYMEKLTSSWPTQEEKVELSQFMQEEAFPGCIGFVDGKTIPLSQKLQYHAKIAIYSQKFRFLSSLKNSLIKISSFWKTQLIKVIGLNSQLIKGMNYLTTRMLISITIFHSHDLRELRTQIRNQKESKDTIKWIINFVPDLAPVAEDNIENSNNGICGILTITLSHFEEPQ